MDVYVNHTIYHYFSNLINFNREKDEISSDAYEFCAL